MKNYIIILVLHVFTFSKAEIKVKVYTEKTAEGFSIFVDNNEHCPVSIKLDFVTENLMIEGGNNKTYLVNSLKKKQLITKLNIISKTKKYSYSYNFLTNYGDVNLVNYDKNFEYNLPFNRSEQYKITQGYNGKLSHKNENALDFLMPIGTEIHAMREGVVIDVVDHNSLNCAQEECKKYNNYITVYHPDGTFASYVHIKNKGSVVKVGEKIIENQLIGYSGNVGWSTGPHLHIVIFKMKMNNRETLKTLFKIDDGKQSIYLQDKMTYNKNY